MGAEELELAEELRQLAHGGFVGGFPRHLVLRGGEGGGQDLLELRDFGCEVLALRELQAEAQREVVAEPIAQFHDLALVGGAFSSLDLRGACGLLLKVFEVVLQLVEGETHAAVAVLSGEVEEREYFGVVDPEVLVGVGQLGLEDDVEQPLVRRERFADGVLHRLLVLEEQQGGARDGIQRLESAAEQHGQAAEALGVEVGAVGGRAQRGGYEEQNQQAGEEGEKAFHSE